jgi:hypothetical protein
MHLLRWQVGEPQLKNTSSGVPFLAIKFLFTEEHRKKDIPNN